MHQSMWSFETEESIYKEFFIDQLKSCVSGLEDLFLLLRYFQYLGIFTGVSPNISERAWLTE
jgi:hypothetical protein